MFAPIPDDVEASSRRHAGPLCCCEYIDRNRERNHLAACFCNCVDLDLAFDRLICCRRVPEQTRSGMLLTLQDRMRFPWPGGARRVHVTTVLPIVLVPAALALAACSLFWTCVMMVGVPAFLMYMARYLSRTDPRTNFFLSWNVWSVFCLWILFESTVPLLEILPIENFALILLMSVSVICFYLVKQRAPLDFVATSRDTVGGQLSSPSTALLIDATDPHAPNDTTTLQMDDVIAANIKNERVAGTTDDDDDDEDDSESAALPLSGNPAVCPRCRKYAPPRSYHCFVCNACVVRQDHHNVWLNCCIGQTSYRLYFVGGAFGVAALVVGVNLALTAICHPFLVGSFFGVFVFLPDDCGEVYMQYDIALCFVGSVYGLVMALCLFVDFLRQVWQITSGVTWAEKQRGHRKDRRNVLHNWKVFICLMRG